MIRVLLVDDQELVRSGFRAIVEADGSIEVVGEAKDGQEAVSAARQTKPDVVVMDIRMPGVDGIEATRRILRDPGAPRILILTTFDLDDYVYEALRAGASGFLLKDVRRDELIAGIRVVARGEALLAPAITRRLIERFVTRSPRESPARLEDLSERETDVLNLLARGLSNAEIAHELVVSVATVKTHVAHILRKLDLRDRVQAVVLAYETGLIDGDR